MKILKFIETIGSVLRLLTYILIAFVMLLILIPLQGLSNTLKTISNKLK